MLVMGMLAVPLGTALCAPIDSHSRSFVHPGRDEILPFGMRKKRCGHVNQPFQVSSLLTCPLLSCFIQSDREI